MKINIEVNKTNSSISQSELIVRLLLINVIIWLQLLNAYFKIDHLWVLTLLVLIVYLLINRNWFKGNMNKKQEKIVVINAVINIMIIIVYLIF
jgi:hypothetical protein